MKPEDFRFRYIGLKGPGKWMRCPVDEIATKAALLGERDVCASLQRYPTANKMPDEPLLTDFAIDLDSEIDVDIAKEDAIKLVDFFVRAWDLGKDDFRIYFSGSKGFHIVIQAEVLGVPADSEKIQQRVFRRIAAFLAVKLKLLTLDLNIYSNGRFLTLPNTIHSKTGLRKIFLDPSELHLSVAEIKEKANGFVEFESPSVEQNQTASSEFLALYEEFLEEERESEEERKNASPETNQKIIDGTTPNCVKRLLEAGPTNGKFNKEKLRLLRYFGAKGVSREEAS